MEIKILRTAKCLFKWISCVHVMRFERDLLLSIQAINFIVVLHQLKVGKSRKQFIRSSIVPKTNETHYAEDILNIFGRIEETIICF